MISNFSIWVCCHVVEKFRERFGGMLGAGGLGGGKITKGNQHCRINSKGVEDDTADGLLDVVDTFGVKTGICWEQFVV